MTCHMAYARYLTHLRHGGTFAQPPTVIVVHSMAEYVGQVHAVPFLDSIGLSAHALGAPDGSVYRCRTDEETAYHARGHNGHSLGYEFLVPGEHDYASFLDAIRRPYLTEGAYQAGLQQIRDWCDLWPIRSIVRHSDIDPGRKVDPGEGFPWEQFLQEIGL